MRKRLFILSIITLLSVIAMPGLRAQMAGNPIVASGTGEWTISAMGVYQDLEGQEGQEISRRLLLKSGWGITRWLDVYVIGGGVQLEMRTTQIDFVGFKSKYHFGYGAGARFVFNSISGTSMSLWGGAQILRFPSTGSFKYSYTSVGQNFIQESEMNYDWRELQMAVGVMIPFRSIRLYVAAAGWAVQRLEKKKEYLEYGNTTNYLGEVEGEYQSGLWSGGIAGIEFLLQQRFSISIECLIFNTSSYQIMVGISQTGMNKW